MARWPDVPAAFGWLALDARGNWLLRHPLDAARFERIANPLLREFIGRNYAADSSGRWYFQNGPQRVYVKLERTPLVYRLDQTWVDHCGRPAGRIAHAWLDETGAMILLGGRSVGVVDDRDLERVSQSIVDPADLLSEDWRGERPAGEAAGMLQYKDNQGNGGDIPIYRIESRTLPDRFGFVLDPRPGA